MLDKIGAIEGFAATSRVDRIRDRITEIENKFGIGNIGGQDFQKILEDEMKKMQKLKLTPTEKPDDVVKIPKADANAVNEIEDKNQVETFGAKDSEKVDQPVKQSKNYLPGEEALPDTMSKAINPFAAMAANPKTTPEQVDEEFIETPTRDTKRLTSASLTTEDLIEAAADKYGVDSKLVKAVAIAESNMNQDDISDAGAIGVMQLMPETAEGLGVDPYDKQQNIEGGAKYLRQMLDTFDGNVKHAVAAYNAGPGAVQRYGGIPPYSETQHYVGRVMDLYG